MDLSISSVVAPQMSPRSSPEASPSSSPPSPSPAPSSPSPKEGSLSKKMTAMSVSPTDSLTGSGSRASNASKNPAPDSTKGYASANGSAKLQNTRLDPRSLSFQPTGHTQGPTDVFSTQRQASNSPTRPAQGLSPTSNSVFTTPASQRTYGPTTPSSVPWSSSSNTQYSWDGSGSLKTTAAAKRLSEPDVLGLDGRLNNVLGNSNPPFQLLTEDTVTHWLLVCGIARALLIHKLINVPKTAELSQLRHLLDKLGETKAIIAHHLMEHGRVVVAFWDSREAYKVYKELCRRAVRFSINKEAQQLHCVCIREADVRGLTGDGPEWNYLWNESNPIVHIQARSMLGVEAGGFKAQLSDYGDLKSFRAHDSTGHTFTAEFYDSRVAADIIRTYNNLPISGGTFVVSYVSDDPFLAEPSDNTTSNFPDYNTRPALAKSAWASTFSRGRTSVSAGSPTSMAFSGVRDAAFSHAASAQGLSSFLDMSLSSTDDFNRRFDSAFQSFDTASSNFRQSQSGIIPRRNSPLNMTSDPSHQWGSVANDELYIATRTNRPPNVRRFTDSATLQTMLNGMNETAQALQHQSTIGGSISAPLSPTLLNPRLYSGWPQNDSKAVPVENQVFPERIAAGLDNPTTVMVKDVPNKLSRQELVDILNQVVPSHFDFVYLRFDFHNHCNVGYAFVNFTSTIALLEFYRARVGKRWNLFSSEKVLQVGYANIQGKVALVNKFRNSAVMDVQEQWRPQIFYSDGAMRGKPEPFPESDSTSRGQRAASSARLSFLTGSSPDMIDYDYSNRPYDCL
ncbi:hypothetical protein CcaverHIS002_0105100 [Cutaneotrichosporon cavernicola]|nr:hypothetical protein CcaverHIS002_0105100 [Cutaneotrichosporon cavernicola]